MLAELGVDIGDPVDRLWKVDRRMDAIKRSDEDAIWHPRPRPLPLERRPMKTAMEIPFAAGSGG